METAPIREEAVVVAAAAEAPIREEVALILLFLLATSSEITPKKYVAEPKDQRKYGATSPDVDCSMFTQEVAAKEGKTIPRSSVGQKDWFNDPQNGTPVTKVSDLQVGDLAFWSRDGTNVSHVGIITQTSPTIKVVHATVFGNNPESIRENKVSSDGKIEHWNEHTFVGGGRFK